MAQLLVNKSFQVFAGGLAALGCVTALMATGTITTQEGLGVFYAVIGFLLGVPVSTAPVAQAAPIAAVVAPAPAPAPVPVQPAPIPAPVQQIT